MNDAKPKIWEELRKPFPREVIGLLPKPISRDAQNGKCPECGKYHKLPAVHLDYVGHAAVTDRLNNIAGVDGWNWEPFALDESGLPKLDRAGNLWIKLTIHNVTKIGVGDGTNAKEIIGDAIRNAAMRFGIALDLWSKEELESTLTDAKAKNDKPSTKLQDPGSAAAPISKAITQLQATVLVSMAKKASGLVEKQDVIDFIEETAGKKMPQILQSEFNALRAQFKVTQEDEGGDDGVQV